MPSMLCCWKHLCASRIVSVTATTFNRTCRCSCKLSDIKKKLFLLTADVVYRQVSDAIPIPGFLETLQPTVQAARNANSSSSDSFSSSSSGSSSPVNRAQTPSYQLLAAAAAAAAPLLAEQQQQLLVGAAPALDQLSSVVNEVRQHHLCN